MRAMRRHLLLPFLVELAHCAVNLKGQPVVNPLSTKDPSPISDGNTYYPDQFDCPLPCSDYSNINAWTPYFSLDRLDRCTQPMLLALSMLQPLDDPQTTILIRSCTIDGSSSSLPGTGVLLDIPDVENPKKSEDAFESSLDTAPACFATGKEAEALLDVRTGAPGGPGGNVEQLLKGFQSYFFEKENCDEQFILGYHKKTAAGLYIGPGLGKTTVKDALQALIPLASSTKRTVGQICQGRPSVFGVSIDASGDLAGIQKTLLAWSKGVCYADASLAQAKDSPKVKVFDIAAVGATSNSTSSGSGTLTKSISTASARSSSSTASVRSSSSTAAGSSSTSNSSSIPSSAASSKSPLTLSTAPLPSRAPRTLLQRRGSLDKRATCRYVRIEEGDGCGSLAGRCGISGDDFMRYNSAPGYCGNLKAGEYACCSEGDRYSDPKPTPPSPDKDGNCAWRYIVAQDTCDDLAKRYGVTINDLENWNRKKTWAWTTCGKMLAGYNMCISPGYPPLPPPQQGSECGPIKPGTTMPSDRSIPMTSLNPCPLKACCSNWGFCGPFGAHCDINAYPDGGPGAKLTDAPATCISNCGTEIKQNSGPPAAFNRIGYYSSWNLGRSCLWLKAADANTDGSYTTIHWAFAIIDPNTWKPVINDTFGQWNDFKQLKGVKRVVSFGGWDYSTEPATFDIIRRAIIDNREAFTTNLVTFINDEGLDGVDIDWEYPGAPDIYVDGKPIGKPTDGAYYYLFLITLRQKLGWGKSISIAAPASYWYLKAFPIDSMANFLDYIVFMTYDLHGQWDYGNVNAFDACPSGKCIRSHVNLTETRNSLSIITKAGVPNNKIFVGEASYGRSFHMAKNNCWGPMCDFTGSRLQSDAQPGRCTDTRGYISNAEIMEIRQGRESALYFHDHASNSDILLYNGDYVSYMTPTTKDTRRADWKAMNFAGSVDWALDLQEFKMVDFNKPPENGPAGAQGCIEGIDLTSNSGDLCEFACAFDFCPRPLCECTDRGTIKALPAENSAFSDAIAWDEFDVDANRLCRFTCLHGYCPDDTCTKPVIDEDEQGFQVGIRQEDRDKINNDSRCYIWRFFPRAEVNARQCETHCSAKIQDAKESGRTTNYGCAAFFEGKTSLPWTQVPGDSSPHLPGTCLCDNMFINEVTDLVLEALPAIAQIGCFIIMSALKLIIDIGSNFFAAGRAVSVGADAAATAAKTIEYVYPASEDRQGAFNWWLSPCGGDHLVPNGLKLAFEILGQVAEGATSFRKPKNIRKGSGRKGDNGNPHDQSKPRSAGKQGGTQAKCRIRAGQSTVRKGRGQNTLLKQSCVNNKTRKQITVVTSLTSQAGAGKEKVTKTCGLKNANACYHYSSANRVNPAWATLTCAPHIATTSWSRTGGAVVPTYYSSHHTLWRDASRRREPKCDVDEWPPAYFLGPNDRARLRSGLDASGQLVRYIPRSENRGAAQAWQNFCMAGTLQAVPDADFERRAQAAVNKRPGPANNNAAVEYVGITVPVWAEFSFAWEHAANPLPNDALDVNPCLPNNRQPVDPGFALVQYDPYYGGRSPPYNYAIPP